MNTKDVTLQITKNYVKNKEGELFSEGTPSLIIRSYAKLFLDYYTEMQQAMTEFLEEASVSSFDETAVDIVKGYLTQLMKNQMSEYQEPHKYASLFLNSYRQVAPMVAEYKKKHRITAFDHTELEILELSIYDSMENYRKKDPEATWLKDLEKYTKLFLNSYDHVAKIVREYRQN